MKDTRFNKAIQDIKKISMTSAEKQMILGRVLDVQPVPARYKDGNKYSSIKSPWTVYSFNMWIQQHRWISAVVVIAVVLLAGNSAVRASNDALPGDTLYPIKVNIVEPVRVALAATPVAKAEIQAELVQKRLQEAETLAARGTLTDDQEREIQQRVDTQKIELAVHVSEVQKTAPEKAQDINTTVEASINTHERVLNALAINRGQFRAGRNRATSVVKRDEPKNTQKDDTENVVVVARAPNIQSAAPVASVPQSAQGMSVPAAPVMTAAAPMVAPVTVTPEQLAPPRVHVVSTNVEYQKKKARLQSLIQRVSAEIASTTHSATSSLIKQAIADDAKSSLQRAQDSLSDADTHDQNGEADQSYSALIDSERQAKEATLLVEANNRLDKDVRKQEIRSKTTEKRSKRGD